MEVSLRFHLFGIYEPNFAAQVCPPQPMIEMVSYTVDGHSSEVAIARKKPLSPTPCIGSIDVGVRGSRRGVPSQTQT